MSSATRTSQRYGIGGDWLSAGFTGVIAGIVFGLLIQFGVGAMNVVGALFSTPGIVSGWIVHMGFSILFAVVFASILELDSLEKYRHRWTTGIGLGLAYGALLWAVNLAIIWPIWLQAVGFPPADAMTVPYLHVKPFVGHLVYGAILGGGYPLIR